MNWAGEAAHVNTPKATDWVSVWPVRSDGFHSTSLTGALVALNPRELDVLREMAQGRGNQGIAADLHLSESSVEKHVNGIFSKLGLSAEPSVHRRVAAVLTFLRNDGS